MQLRSCRDLSTSLGSALKTSSTACWLSRATQNSHSAGSRSDEKMNFNLLWEFRTWSTCWCWQSCGSFCKRISQGQTLLTEGTYLYTWRTRRYQFCGPRQAPKCCAVAVQQPCRSQDSSTYCRLNSSQSKKKNSLTVVVGDEISARRHNVHVFCLTEVGGNHLP